MKIGIDSFVSVVTDPVTGVDVGGAERVRHLLEEVETADRVGLDTYGIGEHHRAEYMDSAPAVLLAAAAARTTRIRLNSAVAVLSAADPVRLFQEFATLDLVSQGRIDLVVGRGSFTESFPLFGLPLEEYDALFAEKLELLLALRAQPEVTWSGRFRAPLTGQGVYPRPLQDPLPVWVGVGGTPESFVRAGLLGLPLMVAIIGGQPARFRPLVDLYRRAGAEAGHPAEQLQVGVHAFGYVAETDAQARDAFYPGWAQMFTKIGRERGFGAPVRSQFEAMCEPDGAFLIGSPSTVADQLVRVHDDLAGLARVSLQMTNVRLAHADLLRSIELLGTEVAPGVRERLSAR
ncbi:MAG: Flavin-dependent oxidoreductase, F420-dependent methylene-tetrahydromethanopterin reductase [Frankiales bacterium]|nr:Flavin-dependent oxidoreductase, F420-dependent methylene-tetrahydromethanopterin reductase [Frankiales bacterium]